MGKGWKIFWIVTSAIVIPGGIWAGIGLYALTQVVYSMAGYKVVSISADSVSLNVFVKVFNPSFIAVDVKGYSIDVALNGTPVAKLISKTPYTIASKKTSILTLPIDVDWRTSLKTAASRDVVKYFLTNQTDKIVLQLRGTFRGRLAKVPVKMKIDMNYTLTEIIKIMQEPDAPTPDQKTSVIA